MRKIWGALVAFVVCFCALEGQTQEPPETQEVPEIQKGAQSAEPPEVPVSVTVSGGVSLGAYEAGFLYYVSEIFNRNKGAADLKVVTGASAGSLNGFITLLSTCGAEPEEPRDSLFWSTWGDIGFDSLFVPEKTTPTGALSRAAFEDTIGRIRSRWEKGLPESCDVVFGATVTRLQPYSVGIRGDLLSLPRTREKFVVRIQGRGPGRAPKVTNYITPKKGLEQALLPLDEPGVDSFSLLVDLVMASTAFPIAFPPFPIQHCMHVPLPDGTMPPCTMANSETRLFIDGGVFDNQPLGIAAHAVTRGLEPDGKKWRWKSRPDLQRSKLPPEVSFFSLDPEIRAWPRAHAQLAAKPTHSLFEMGAHLFGTLVSSARSEELQDLLEEHPTLRENLALGRNHLPHASGLLGAFFGFFDRGFREYDFYLGMVDARQFLTLQVEDSLREGGQGLQRRSELVLPEPRWTGDLDAVPPQWHPFFCILGVLEEKPDMMLACSGKEMKGTRVLLQTSLDRLYTSCRHLTQEELSGSRHAHCRKSAQGKEPPRLKDVPTIPQGAWARNEGEPPFKHMLRLLELYQYRFHDLGLAGLHASEAGALLHRRIVRVGDRLAAVHKEGGAVITTVMRRGANYIEYVPPPEMIYVLLGSSPEVGWSSNEYWGARLDWLRLHAAVAFEGFSALPTSADGDYGALFGAGLVAEPIDWSNGGIQFRLGLRGGVMLSTADKVFFGPCRLEETGENVGACSRAAAQSFVSLSLYDRLRLQLTGTWLPPVREGAESFWSFGPSVGLQFYGPF